MTVDELDILKHTLGIRPGNQGGWRNRFVTEPSSPDGIICRALVDAGLMEDGGRYYLADGMNVYRVTEFGKKAAVTKAEPPR